MTEVFDSISAQYHSLLTESTTVCFMSCITQEQKRYIELIAEFIIETCTPARAKFAAQSNDAEAKKLLVIEAQLTAILHELECLTLLKSDEAESAWDHLVHAQNAVSVVGKFHGGAESQFERLRLLESMLFPRQTFMSAGFIIQESTCGICSEDYDVCDHEIGEYYLGTICTRTIIKAKLKETSVLTEEEPYDRRCRVTHFSETGIKTNLMTREKQKIDIGPPRIHGYPIRY